MIDENFRSAGKMPALQFTIFGADCYMLHIDKLNKSYGKRQVLQDLTLRISPGEIYGLKSANGAGKTTIINIICNLLKADRGYNAPKNESSRQPNSSSLGTNNSPHGWTHFLRDLSGHNRYQ